MACKTQVANRQALIWQTLSQGMYNELPGLKGILIQTAGSDPIGWEWGFKFCTITKRPGNGSAAGVVKR